MYPRSSLVTLRRTCRVRNIPCGMMPLLSGINALWHDAMVRSTSSDVGEIVGGQVFRDRLRFLEMSACQFARRTGIHYRTVLGWGTVRDNGSGDAIQVVPTWASLLLSEWEAHGVPEFTEG